jgi:hypothetical protein
VLFNALGAGLGLLVFWWWQRRRRKNAPVTPEPR